MLLRRIHDNRRFANTTILRIADNYQPTRRYISEYYNLQKQRHRENVTPSLLTVRQPQLITHEASDRSQHQQKT